MGYNDFWVKPQVGKNVMEKIGINIKAGVSIYLSLGVSIYLSAIGQAALASLFNISPSTVQKWEQG
ncbi:MAG TPA: hypothetical protein VJ879_06340, partial [Desulfobacter sp.]|nr:hypothetical protein [Desulfobacter sp.]